MRQVPASQSYLIIGNGRVARHFQHYFTLENLNHDHWSRQSSENLEQLSSSCTHVLLLISDPSIQSFYDAHSFLKEKICVHFSGSLVLPRVIGAHPLMTFSNALYNLETYRRIPFILERGRMPFTEALPGLKNPSFELDAAKKVLYHALCVLAGNFTVVLWEKVFKEFSDQLALPKETLIPYLLQIAQNLAQSNTKQSVLTGPLARHDRQTVDRHLNVLSQDPFQAVYRAIVEAYSHQEAQNEISP